MKRQRRSRAVTLGTSFLTLAASLTTITACGDESQTLYCADEHRYVVEQERCDKGEDGVFIYHGYWNSGIKPGTQLTQSGTYSDKSGRIAASDQNARAKFGLPRTGGFGGNGKSFSTGG